MCAAAQQTTTNDDNNAKRKPIFADDEFSDKAKKNFLDGHHAFFVEYHTEIIHY